ncbi:hypothetical protein GCM10007036_28600 [Alsobacter metallidurans]|uniref:Uncharacterized protein n=1 Tax=Alsobacter metallidurans TaxID=340221 RepID=A0A917I7M0_9HYPH|nr:hypothetical protein [Alsobacter metallidurans]GGH23094.1 hypothetical protein GCM10007036_28600 [Alsobacter metallidurans]
MRTLIGMIFGFMLAVGVAYVHDNGAQPGQNMVNWDVAHRSFQSATAQVQDGWRRLTSKVEEKSTI